MADFFHLGLMPFVSKQFSVQCFVATLFHSSVTLCQLKLMRPEPSSLVEICFLCLLSEAAPVLDFVQPGLQV